MEIFWLLLFVILFIPATMLWLRGVRALGRAAKNAVTQKPAETMNWIKFFVDLSRK